MRRREFISFSGATVAWPGVGLAQQPGRMRRIGVLMPTSSNDSESPARVAALAQGLQQLGWTLGGNVRIDYRWSAADPDSLRKHAAELIELSPDVILTSGSAGAGPLIHATRTIPIVFVIVPDAVGAGFVESLSRPGGNATGFLMFEFGISGKWLELLKLIAPNVTRAAVLRDAATTAGIGQFSVIQAAAPSTGVEVSPINLRQSDDIEPALAAFARSSNGGLIVTASALSAVHRDVITASAIRHKLPAIYPSRHYAADGGLIAYGPDFVDQLHRSHPQGREAGR